MIKILFWYFVDWYNKDIKCCDFFQVFLVYDFEMLEVIVNWYIDKFEEMWFVRCVLCWCLCIKR